MRAVEIILVAAALAGALVFVLSTLLRRARERRAPWRLIEDADHDQVIFYACRPGHERQVLGAVPPARAGELRGEAERRVAALNADV